MRTLTSLALLAALGLANGAEPLVIHEWGTFTSLQDPQGATIGGINTDEEVLPTFVDQLPVVSLRRHSDLAPRFVKHVPRLSPGVTMRLETPVLYVHLPPNEPTATLDVSVTFRGGMLTQFYPRATAVIDGRSESVHGPHWYRITNPDPTGKTVSTLTWSGVIAGGTGDGPTTTSPVWLAPRQVDAALLTVGEQRERYLFYRGLGHLDAPLTVGRGYTPYGRVVYLHPTAKKDGTVTALPELWLADLRGDGTAAFRRAIQFDAERTMANIDDRFVDADYSVAALAALRQELQGALVQDGLFADEATALLTTWEASYFKAPGQRLFFLVPRAWTDAHLPLTVSREARIVRSMVGRIELVTPHQEAALARIAAGPVSQPGWYYDLVRSELIDGPDGKPTWKPGSEERIQQLFAGEPGVLARLKVKVPEDYAAYLSLGRFRDALLLNHEQHTHDPELVAFHRTYLVDQLQAMVDASAHGNSQVLIKETPSP